MSDIPKLRKWHFLFLGSALILLSALLWYWNWRHLGIPSPLRAEHLMTAVSLIVGFFILGVFVYRLNRVQVTIMLVGAVIVNLLAALTTLWIFRAYPAFFELIRPMELTAYDPAYIADWRDYFLTPAVYGLHIGLLLLWAESLVMFLIRKPTDQPE
jgi:hypothetical protein